MSSIGLGRFSADGGVCGVWLSSVFMFFPRLIVQFLIVRLSPEASKGFRQILHVEALTRKSSPTSQRLNDGFLNFVGHSHTFKKRTSLVVINHKAVT